MANLNKGQTTRKHALATATKLFAKQGYEGTSIEDVLAATGLSRGALYYHFASKEQLFEAVLDALEAQIAVELTKASRGEQDPVLALRTGCDAFLKMALDPTIRQIVLVDAPVAIGWQKWREIDARHGFGLMQASVKAAARAGHLSAEFVEMFAHVLLAAVMETALVIARSDNPKAAMRNGRAVIGELIGKLMSR